MRCSKCWMGAGILLLTLALNAQAAPTVTAARAEKPVTLDGKLNEPAWQAAQAVTDFRIANSDEPAKYKTEAKVLFDDNRLYIGVICHEPDIKTLFYQDVPRDNGNVFRGDCVEIMLDPWRSKNDYYHLAVNVSGAVFDRSVTQSGHVGDNAWNGKWQAKTCVGKDFWSCEVAVPYFILGLTPKTSDTWYINICREKKQPYAENASIADNGAFNVAGRFATLTGLKTDFSRFCYELTKPTMDTRVHEGALSVAMRFDATNRTGQPRTVKLETILIAPDGAPRIQSESVALTPDKAVTVRLPEMSLTAQGEYTCHLRVVDPALKKTLAMREDKVTVSYVPITIDFKAPWYRDAVFESMKLEDVVAEIALKLEADKLKGRGLTALIRKEGTQEIVARSDRPIAQPVQRVAFSNADLPYGNLEFVAQLTENGKVVEETSRRLQKLASKPGETWLGRDGVWRVDGKPFFFNAAWNYESDFNPWFNAFTTRMGNGVKHVAYLHMPANLRAELVHDTISKAFAEALRAKVREVKDNEDMVLYYLDDEPECSGFSAKGLAAAYRVVREEDPYHPVTISNDSLHGLIDYADAAEINGLHPYPPIFKDQRINDFSELVMYMDEWRKAHSEGTLPQTITFMHQGFNYGDYGAVNNRVPNYAELRRQNLIALTLGATGIMQFDRIMASYPELRIGIPHLTRELAWHGPAIVSPTSKRVVKTDHPSARALLKEMDGELRLFVANCDTAPRTITVTVEGMGQLARQLLVVPENRAVTLKGDTFTDTFDTFGVHVYTTAKQKPDLPAVADIEAEIAAANAARKKPGNLVFQNMEGDGVILTASTSTAGKYRRPDCGLWHVLDGVVAEIDRYHNLTWSDTTPNEGPDWLAIQMPKAHAVGRVVVYPFNKSLKDYSVQAFMKNGWQTVASVSDCDQERIEHTFKPVETDRIRLWILGTNGKHARVAEIEVYEK